MALQSFIDTIKIYNENDRSTHEKIILANNKLKLCADPTSAQISESISQLIQAVGKERLERVCKMPGINIDTSQLESKTLVLTIETMQKILVGLLNPHRDDFSLDSGKAKYVGPLPTTMTNLRAVLKGLLPKMSDFYVDKAQTSGKGFKGLIERFCIMLKHSNTVHDSQKRGSIEVTEAEFLTSRFADREMQEDFVIALKDGLYVVDKVFTKDGAYVSVLKDLANKNPPKIICRGTAGRRNATEGFNSVLNDLLIEIGSRGTKGVWPDLCTYLQDNNIKEVEILGKSLGGAHAMGLSVLIEGLLGIRIKKLTTTCSVGAGYLKDLFRTEVLAKRTQEDPFIVHPVRNGGETEKDVDYIPAVGGEHLGEGVSEGACKTTVTYIGSSENFVIPSLSIGLIPLALRFFASFSAPHCRQYTLGNFTCNNLTGEEAQKHLRLGNLFEKARLVLAYFIHFATFTFFNGSSFAKFYQEQKALLEAKRNTVSEQLIPETN